MDMMIGATVQRGAGVANNNVKYQLPQLISVFPELKSIYTATINLRLDKPLHILKFDRTAFIRWWDVAFGRVGFWHRELFSILPIRFEYPVNQPSKTAWLFVSHHSSYFQKAKTIIGRFRFGDVEVVTEKIDGLMYGQRCKIHVEKADDIEVG